MSLAAWPPFSHHLGGDVNHSVVPVEQPVSSHHLQPLFPQNLQKRAQGLYDVAGIHHSPPGHVVGIDEALVVEEGQDHLLGPGCMDLGLHWPRLTLWKPLPGLLLSFWCVN